MYNDPVVEEMRENGQMFIANYKNNLADVCKALKNNEQILGRVVINRLLIPSMQKKISSLVVPKSIS